MNRELSIVLASIDHIKEYPVLDWAPTQRQDIGIHIDVRTHWFIEQEPITNRKIIRLFSNILVGMGENAKSTIYELRTPNLAFEVDVIDVPFLLVDYIKLPSGTYEGITNQGERINFYRDGVYYVEHPHTKIASPAIENKTSCWVRFSRQCSIDWALEFNE